MKQVKENITVRVDFKELFRSSPLPSLLLAADGDDFIILDQNQAHADITRSRPDKTVGRPLIDAFPGIFVTDSAKQEDSLMIATLKRVVKSNQAETLSGIRYDLRDENGNTFRRFWKIHVAPVPSAATMKTTAVLMTTEDVTHTKLQADNLKLLGQAGRQFAASLKYTDTLHNIASLVVPDVADWCTIDLLRNDGQIENVVLIHKDPKKVAWAKELQAKQGAPDPKDPTGVPNVIRTGEPEHIPIITDEMLVAMTDNEEELELARSLNFSSVMIVPMRIDNRTIGALSLISTEGQRHYDQDDLEVAMSLAERAALAVYNANLYTSARDELNERKRLQSHIESINESLEEMVAQRTAELEAVNRGLEKEINKRERAESELLRSNDELQNFAYVASHDLQEPLRKIQAFGDLLETEYADSLGDGKDYLERMLNAAARMSTLIEDLLAFSRVTTKRTTPKSVDLNQVVGEVISDLEAAISSSTGKVVVDKLPTVKADATHMRQLFQNLIGNAIKFRREDVPPEVHVSSKKSGKFCEITVKDNGIGFDEKYIDRIFTVFQRLHGRDGYSGTGIGLAVCQKIVQRYNGIITAKSRPGHGSTFIIKLPN